MPRKTKEIALWIVRFKKAGGYAGTYYAYNAAEAINKAVRSEVAMASTFRKSSAKITPAAAYVAAIEPRTAKV